MALELNGTTGVSLVQDGVVATADLADGAVTAAKLFSGFANGITEADYYYNTTNISVDTDPVTTWSRQDKMGTGLTYASGIFTFPSTGYWLIQLSVTLRTNAAGTTEMRILTTSDNSSYSAKARAINEVANATQRVDASFSATLLFGCTSTSTHKIKTDFTRTSSGSIAFGNTSGNTSLSFVRLGDI